VTLEFPQGQPGSQLGGTYLGSGERGALRARVAWVQRPHSIRDFFQVAVELENPADVWGIGGYSGDARSTSGAGEAAQSKMGNANNSEMNERGHHENERGGAPVNPEASGDNLMTDIDYSAVPSGDETAGHGFTGMTPGESISAVDSPLLRELRAELDRQAKEAVAAAADQARGEMLKTAEEAERKHLASAEELFAQWKSEIERMQSGAREEFLSHISARRDEVAGNLQSQFDERLAQARDLMGRIEQQAEGLRNENAAVQEAARQVAQTLEQLQAMDTDAGAARAARPAGSSQEEDTALLRQRLESEMGRARGQWNDLLQSSLDHNLRQAIEQVAQRSEEVVRSAEQKMNERLGELREPFAQAAAEARDTFAGIQSALEQEVNKAQESLAAVEQVAGRAKEFSTQVEAATHDTLNELHRRLEKILDSQTAEMNRRAAGVSEGLSQRVGPILEAKIHEALERMASQAEAQLAPHLEHVPVLLDELSAREAKLGENLRLHGERLREVSADSQREAAARIAETMAHAQADMEAARKDAHTKWVAELDANGVKAAHAATEAIGYTSEWLQQEARLRFLALAEQAVIATGAQLAEKSAAVEERFESQIASQAEVHVAQIRLRVENNAVETIAHTRTELDRAAEAAAASFGHVLHEVSEREITQFGAAASSARRERIEEVERATQQLHQQLDMNAFASAERFRAQMASQLEASVSEGRAALSSEFGASFEAYRNERDAHQQEWLDKLDKISGDTAGKFQERLQNTADSWVVSSVRRLNEHGQNGIESLLRLADQALRDSCSKVFEGLAQTLRERVSNAAGIGNVAGFAANPNRETSENCGSRNEAQ